MKDKKIEIVNADLLEDYAEFGFDKAILSITSGTPGNRTFPEYLS